MSLTDRFPGRQELIESLSKDTWCDVLVIGGGIHGATVAHLAAFNGLKTVLLEQVDYASGTSSRSSKLIHGGLRYLEKYDFAQVYRGVQARAHWLNVAPHLVRKHEFQMPIHMGSSLFRLQLVCGMALYKVLAGHIPKPPKWTPRSAMIAPVGTQFAGAYGYTDAIMDDSRLVLEHITAARQEGARCLNYAKVERVVRVKDGRVRVFWRDNVNQNASGLKEIEAGIVFNCAGPWATDLSSSDQYQQRFSRGSHIVFHQPWTGPALIVPFFEGKKRMKGRFYFVLPHPAGTLVGTTEREVTTKPELDPLPDRSEIEEIMFRLQQDFPESGLSLDKAHYCFAGIRSLIAKGSQRTDTSKLGRSHLWVYRNGILTLLGGKFTTSTTTALDGLKKGLSYSETSPTITSVKDRLLPGASNLQDAGSAFQKAAQAKGISELITKSALRRFGSWVRYFEENPEWLRVVKETLLAGEIELAVKVEQALTPEDILRRRLGLEYFVGHGMALLPECAQALGYDSNTTNIETKRYQERLEKIKILLGHAKG